MKKINLSIPKPCHEDWAQMTQVEKGKFCDSCQKVVVDFTKMSDRELAVLFKKSSGSVCGRFQQEQLNHDINIPRKRIPWVKYFFQFTLPAFLISLKTYGDGEAVHFHYLVMEPAVARSFAPPGPNAMNRAGPSTGAKREHATAVHRHSADRRFCDRR